MPRSTERQFPFGDRSLVIYREQWPDDMPVFTIKVFSNLDAVEVSLEIDEREYEILMDALARSAKP
jgi:hypothetical protein